uniref:Immunoglobulin domain-containing protein n=1 Tax=Xenopus tropicalis TaxID=8364 RepID=A0A1B8Y7U1_XENTR
MLFQHFYMNFFIFILFLFFIFTESSVPALVCLRCDKEFYKIKDEFVNLFDKGHKLDAIEYSKAGFIKRFLEKVFTMTFEGVVSKMEGRTLDTLGIAELAKEFRKTMKSIANTKETGTKRMKVIQSNIQELQRKAEAIVQTFEQERACPNLKGVLEQKVIQCGTCREQTLPCVGGSNENKCNDIMTNCLMCICHGKVCHHRTTGKPCQPCTDYHKCLNEMLHCKDQDLQVAEGEDLKFDCNVKFLNNIGGNLEFVLEKKDESGISPLKSVNKHDILIHKVDKEFSGRYTCTAKSKDSMFPISRVDFTVKVVSAPKPQSLGSSLSPPAEEMKDAFKDNQLAQITVICATVISLAITASIMTCICLLIRERKREEKASAQKELEEVKISTDIKKSKPGTREKATQTGV